MRPIHAILSLATVFLCLACMEGPQGPSGKDGAGAVVEDSVVIPGMDPFLLWYKRDTAATFSPAANARYAGINQSAYLLDTTVTEYGSRELMLFVRTKYVPRDWHARRVVTGLYSRLDPGADTTGWLIKREDSYWASRISPVSAIDYGYVGSYYPGKGFNLRFPFADASESRTVIYYWK